MPEKIRCAWCTSDPLYLAYHDEEWGVPLHDARKLFEMLILEGAQAGLSWLTILRSLRRAQDRTLRCSQGGRADAGRGHHPQPAQDRGGDFQRVRFPGGGKGRGRFRAIYLELCGRQAVSRARGAKLNTTSPEAEEMSRALKARGFRFVGPTICYAFMQAVGMVNDHARDCFRRGKVTKM
jgi:DNA-3-methyladenine glycosylase I